MSAIAYGLCLSDEQRGDGWVSGVRRLPSSILIAILRAYQIVISPLYGSVCKYYPSCSHYAIIAIRTHGAFKGSGLAIWRVLRCNPWSKGGVDDVPARRVRPQNKETSWTS